jgi:hypothetical protein
MVNPSTPSAPAIGGCLRCHQLFLITDGSAACLICGRAPDLSLPFGRVVCTEADAELEPIEPAEELPAAIPYAIKCPHCDNDVQLLISDTEIMVVPPAPLLPVEEAGPDHAPSPEPASPPAPAPAAAAEESPR